MSRYIDADKLREVAIQGHSMFGEPGKEYVTLSEIDSAPTEDVEAVVRCKDCKAWDKSISFMSACACSHWSPSRSNPRYTTPDDFCSAGIREDGGEQK